jgi:maltose O-acetyltransferase
MQDVLQNRLVRALNRLFDAVPVFDYAGLFLEYRVRRRLELQARRRNPGIHASVRLGRVTIDRNVSIGEGTYIRTGSEIWAGKHGSVKIGRHCAIGRNVSIKARTHDPAAPTGDGSGKGHAMRFGHIVIGDHVWIGDGVFIREGVTIGDRAIVGANSVVTSDIPALGVAGGVPARVLRTMDAPAVSGGRDALAPGQATTQAGGDNLP